MAGTTDVAVVVLLVGCCRGWEVVVVLPGWGDGGDEGGVRWLSLSLDVWYGGLGGGLEVGGGWWTRVVDCLLGGVDGGCVG